MQPSEQESESPTGRDLQREETRRRVRECSLEVFRRDGIDAARIDDIAKAAGVSRGTFYFHFPTKEDVLVELLREAEHRVAAAVATLPKTAPPKKVLLTFSVQFAAEWEGERTLFPYVGAVAVRRAAAGFTVDKGDESPVRYVLGEYFRAAVKRRELTMSLPPVVLADFFLVNAFSAALAWCGHPTLPLRSVLSTVVEIFLNGARAARR